MGISLFEVIGPVMRGPSSSHTAGMARIGEMTAGILSEEPREIALTMSPKLSATYKGHRSHVALVGGAMGISPEDPLLIDALQIAEERGIKVSTDFFREGEYPQNTARISLTTEEGKTWSVTGVSVGGGSIKVIEIDQAPVELGADTWHLIVWGQPEQEALLEAERLLGASRRASGVNGDIFVWTFVTEPDEALVQKAGSILQPKKCSLAAPVLPYGASVDSEAAPASCREVFEEAGRKGMSLAEAACAYEARRSGRSAATIRSQMAEHLSAMKEAQEKSRGNCLLLYGLTGGKDGEKLEKLIAEGGAISGGLIPEAVAAALRMMEYNASMGCIVAAPTAGSAGIVPACLLTAGKHYGYTDEDLVDALLTAALIGVILDARGVSFSGSVGGCQGEVGVSSALAAAALTSLRTSDPDKILHAMAMALKNLLGLVCDPIAGPVEVPCIKRNAVGTANAFTSADMALAGITSVIPPDEVIDALIDVEKRMPSELKCAAVGGLACTKTAERIRRSLKEMES